MNYMFSALFTIARLVWGSSARASVIAVTSGYHAVVRFERAAPFGDHAVVWFEHAAPFGDHALVWFEHPAPFGDRSMPPAVTSCDLL